MCREFIIFQIGLISLSLPMAIAAFGGARCEAAQRLSMDLWPVMGDVRSQVGAHGSQWRRLTGQDKATGCKGKLVIGSSAGVTRPCVGSTPAFHDLNSRL